ncbi:hypothetical protein QJQ45_027924, partial [Haematococcus lacustris]
MRTKAEQGKAAKAKPAPQPGRWLDRDCNAALNMQRIGEAKRRPLELCYWPEQGKLPAKVKEYPELGYKRLRDKPPKPSSSSSSLLRHSSSAMKGKKRKGAKEPKQPNPKQPKPKPKGKPDDLGWVGPLSPQGRALKERLKEAAKSRIQVVKCYLKGFIRGRNQVKNKIVAHIRLRMGIHHKQRKLASLAVLVLLAKCLVGPPTPGFHPAPPPPSVQPPPAQGAAPLDPLPGSLASGPAAGPAQPAWQPKLQERSSSRLASRRPLPPAPVPPQPLNILDPLAAHNVQDWTEEFAKPSELSGWKQIMRGPAHRQNLRPIPKAFFADPDNAAITAKLVELDKTELLGDSNTIGHLAKQMAVSTQEMFANP